MLVKHGALGALARSNYFALVDSETCIACDACVDRCQVHAVWLENDVAIIDNGKCVGCGLCAYTCPADSISMAIREPDERAGTFATQKDLLQAMAQDTEAR